MVVEGEFRVVGEGLLEGGAIKHRVVSMPPAEHLTTYLIFELGRC